MEVTSGEAEAHFRFGRAQSRWISENYHVNNERVEQILTILGVRPEIDGFAKSDNNRFPRWWGPGSTEATDAFSQDWGKSLLWLNPPFSRFAEVLAKVKEDEAHCILIIPEWKRRRCFKEMRDLRLLDLRYPEGVPFFELPGKRKRPLPWKLRVAYLCGHKERCRSNEVLCTAIQEKKVVLRKAKNGPKSHGQCPFKKPRWNMLIQPRYAVQKSRSSTSMRHWGRAECWICLREQVQWERSIERLDSRYCP